MGQKCLVLAILLAGGAADLLGRTRLKGQRSLPLQDFTCGLHFWLRLTDWTNFDSG